MRQTALEVDLETPGDQESASDLLGRLFYDLFQSPLLEEEEEEEESEELEEEEEEEEEEE